MPVLELDSYLKKIDLLTGNGNHDQAIFHCLYLLRQFPKMLRIYERLGRAFLEKNNYNGALNTYLRMCSAQPDNFLNHISLAYTYVECGRTENAIIHCETASCLQPDNPTIANELSSWMEAHSVSFSSDDRLIGEFTAGIRAFQEKNYAAACKHFLSAERKPTPFLPALYLGLSYFENGDTSKGIWMLESVLKREPYNQTALRTLCVYYSDHDQMKFKRCLDKLAELDPQYRHWEIRDGQIFGQYYPINIAYYDWTGIPNTRVRIGWHQASEKLILNDNSRMPEWLSLLPISDTAADSEESITSLMNEMQASDSGVSFYRKAFFSSKNRESAPVSGESSENARKAQDSGSELDRAFNYLEHVASRGFEPIEPKPSASQPAGSGAGAEAPAAGKAEEKPREAADNTPTIEDRQMMREAWRCFSTDQQELGVQLYRKLIGRETCAAAVREELEKLTILFPENTELADLFNSLKGQKES